MVRADVGQDRHVRPEAGGQVQLVGRHLDHIDGARRRLGQAQDADADVAADVASRPACRRTWPIRAVVVDLPLVPVMATTFGRLCSGSGGDGAGEQLDVADDLDARRPWPSRRSSAARDGSGARPATASGRRTRTSRRAVRSSTAKPSASACMRLDRLSSHSTGSAPPAWSARAAVRPAAAQAEDRDAPPFEAGDRDHGVPIAASGWRGRPGPAWPRRSRSGSPRSIPPSPASRSGGGSGAIRKMRLPVALK